MMRRLPVKAIAKRLRRLEHQLRRMGSQLFVARSAGAGFTVVPSIKSTSCLIASRTCIACIITCEKLGLTFAYI
jgi:hypothetical protein